MGHTVAVAGPNDSQVVNTTGEMRERIGDLDAILSIAAELSLTAEQQRLVHLERFVPELAEARGPLLPIHLVQQRLRVEAIDVARSAGQKQEDDCLRLRPLWHVRWLRRQ